MRKLLTPVYCMHHSSCFPGGMQLCQHSRAGSSQPAHRYVSIGTSRGSRAALTCRPAAPALPCRTCLVGLQGTCSTGPECVILQLGLHEA